MHKHILKILLVLGAIYILGCIVLYFNQEKFIFRPSKLSKQTEFKYTRAFQEIYFTAADSVKIHGLYFTVDNPKGVVYYLHGNSGNLGGWGEVADAYLDLDYNVLMIDYRGFGKSDGKIESQKQFYSDTQLGYDYLKKIFNENQIVIVGFSIGTGAASHLASTNNPKSLVLKAPYFSWKDRNKEKIPYFPNFVLKYKFANYENLKITKCPVYIFHGDKDQILSYESSLKLKEFLKEEDEFITLKKQPHWGINKNPEFLKKLKEILN